jgi:hypothetical protein
MGDHLPRHLELGSAGAARELLDGVTVAVAGREVHGAEVTVGSQRLVDEADAFEELGPVEGGHRPHAGDHVAHRHVHGGLVLELDSHELVGRRSRGRELLVEPGERRHGLGILVTQALDELDGERRRQCGCVKGSEREGPGRLSGETEELVRQGVGFLAGGTSLDDPLGEPPQVLHEHDPEGDGHGPQLPMVSGCTRWNRRTKRSSVSRSKRLSVCPTNAQARPSTRGYPLQRTFGKRGELAVEPGGRSSRICRTTSSTMWKLSTSHSAAGMIGPSSRITPASVR